MKSTKDYRFDKRDKDQFAKDIADCTSIEKQLMDLYIGYLNGRPDNLGTYHYINNGVDNTGQFIEDCDKVHTGADFLLRKEGIEDRKVEIKFCRKNNSAFHLKIAQVQSYIKKDVCIVNWMGIDTTNRRFCILTPAKLKECLEKCKKVNFWFKPCIKISNKDCEWIKV